MLKFKETEIEHILAKPSKESNKCVILLPGISGKALTDRYKDLEISLTNSGYAFLRFDIWTSLQNLENMTLESIHNGINSAIEFIKSQGYTKISFIGKSFGGGVLLTYPNPKISSLILLSPAIGFSKESNIKKIKNKKFRKFNDIFNITINEEELKKITCRVLIIQGTKDPIVPLKNSQNIIKHLSKGKLEIIEGAGHSYEKPGEMEKVIKEIVKFLN